MFLTFDIDVLFLTAKAVMFLTFDIDVFIFTYLDTVQLC